MEKCLYGAYNAIYGSREVLVHKQIEENGDIIQIRIFSVPNSEKNRDGVSYTLVYIRNGERLIGFDNFEGHEEVEKIRKGVLQ